MKTIFLFILCFLTLKTQAQTTLKTLFPIDFDDSPRGYKALRIVFYNTENLFDTTHDTLKSDYSFTSEGENYWTTYKYWQKQNHLAQCLTAIGGWETPEIIGLCEVENNHVLFNLTQNTYLKKYKYTFIHHESQDFRGIDVALLYRKEKFNVISDSAYPIIFPFDTNSRTRDILYVKGIALETDTLHIFITHWPSKYGGEFITIPKRKYVASKIKSLSDEILKNNPSAKIIIMGDFNDTPTDESVVECLQAKPPNKYKKGDLVNLMFPLIGANIGTHFYAGTTGNEWSVLDQIVVNSNLLDSKSGLIVKNKSAHIFSADFLVEKNEKGLIVPNRTFHGMKYHGGFSDHLPVYIDLENISFKN